MKNKTQQARTTASTAWGRQGVPLAVIALLSVAWMGGCKDKPTPRSAGSPCESDDGCDSNLCYTSICLEPAADDDLDGLTNDIESSLGTLPQNADTDGDGISDGVEVGSAGSPHDEDGDGLIDAIESLLTDADNDCLPAQKDDDESTPEEDVQALADKGCCCYGSCSESGITVAPATCEVGGGGQTTISCPPDLEPDTDDDGTPDNCDPCPDDETDTCNFAPHSLALTPASPSPDPTPTLSGVAPHAARIVVTSDSCDGATVGEATGTGGTFQVQVTVPDNATTELHVTAYDIDDAALGCSDAIAYTHDDIPPDTPELGPAQPTDNTDMMEIFGSSEIDTSVSLFEGGTCEAEPIKELKVGVEDWPIVLEPVLPESVTAKATDLAGNESGCTPPLPLNPPANCSDEELTLLQTSDEAGDVVLDALLTCSTLDASEGGCGGDTPASGCIRCVVQQLYPDAIEVRAACSRCLARITPYMGACADTCNPEAAALDGGDACLACACSQPGAEAAVTDCNAALLCEDHGVVPQETLFEAPYLGPTCLETEAGECTPFSKPLTPDCTEVTGGVDAAMDASGTLWSVDVCHKTDGEEQSVGVIAWPPEGADPIPYDLDDFRGTTSIAAYGQSMAAFGTNASDEPILTGKGPDDLAFSEAESGALAGVELYDRPVLVGDKSGWLYTVARVPEAPADRLTVLVKTTDDANWSYAPGVALPTHTDGVVPIDLIDDAFSTGAKPGLDLAPAPPFHLHALLWRANLTGTDNPPMAFHYRLDLSAETVASPSDLSADSAVMESIPFFVDVPFSLWSNQVVGRIAVVAEAGLDGLTTWTPYVAHWIGNQEGGIHERLLVLRRDAQAGEDVGWELLDTHTETNQTAQNVACAEPPKGPDDVCVYTLQRKRLLDLAGGDRLRMLLATHTVPCQVTANCGDTGCTWAALELCDPDSETFGYTLRYQSAPLVARDQWEEMVATKVAEEPIEQGALLIDDQGTIHVVLSVMKGGEVEVQHISMVVPAGP